MANRNNKPVRYVFVLTLLPEMPLHDNKVTTRKDIEIKTT